MSRLGLGILSIVLVFFENAAAQDTLRFSGQLSSWLNYNSGNTLPLAGGLRYIPQLNAGLSKNNGGLFDAEASLNIYGDAATDPFKVWSSTGDIKTYRAWVRYSTESLELRLGLQKLNFGSASMLRPLMWFDQLDPRDPLQLTNGVWGLLGRYYFRNNANLWLWTLYGNNERRGWDLIPSRSNIPEFGGRVQVPVPAGEAALTYHHRIADSRGMEPIVGSFDRIGENKLGIDAKWDLLLGFWIEGSFTHKSRNVGYLTNQLAFNAGVDYTFNAGNGLYAAFEQLYAAWSQDFPVISTDLSFSMLNLSYPVGLFDNISSILYYSWSDNKIYSFLNWRRQFDNVMLYIMAYWNPETFLLPAQTSSQNIFAGKGIQLMFVLNH
ncbi:MAG TPA: hypothetical protein VHO68_09985 [Bacteroidales bacterium]|nr:hypothetical protein [Bacteroidales bacterium]